MTSYQQAPSVALEETTQLPAVPGAPVLPPAPTAGPRASTAPLTISIRLRPLETLRAVPRIGTWTGLALCATSALVLLIAWRQVAGLTEVGLQMPYLISGGLVAVCLLVVGLLLIGLDALAVESARRREQVSELRHLLVRLAPTPTEEDAR